VDVQVRPAAGVHAALPRLPGEAAVSLLWLLFLIVIILLILGLARSL
jgi:hypothetical protein